MLYLEDYLEVIEHLPLELRDRFTDIRERDLQVHNSTEQLKEKVKLFFAEAKKLKPEQRQCEYLKLLNEYQETMNYADDKELIAKQMHNILQKLVQRLDTELEKFKLELEADHAGITEELERRSLELDADNLINNHLNGSSTTINNNSTATLTTTTSKTPSSIKDRRRSEHKHRHHPYQNNQDNGYNNGKAKLSHNEQHHHLSKAHPIHQSPFHHHQHHQRHGSKSNQNGTGSGCQPHTVNIPTYTPSTCNHSISAPASIAGPDHLMNGSSGGGVAADVAQTNGHYGSNLFSSIGNNSGFKNSLQKNAANIPSSQQHSALSAALASTTTTTTTSSHLNSVSALAMMNASQVHNKISNNLKGNNQHDLIDPNSPLVRQNPLAAAASQAIAATQQLHQGRRTPSLKASFAAINAAGLGPLDSLSLPSGKQHDSLVGQNNRNALAPMAPDQQAFRCSNQFGKLTPNGSSSPLYISVTKSGRPTKRPKHHASHLYPDESPTSISSDNSVFENSESLSSTDFIETGTTFGSASPSSLDFSNQATQGGNTTLYHRDETKYCTCRQISYGEMVACDNDECEIEWFHYGCVGITQPPKGKWFCPDCTRKMNGHHHLQQQQSSHPQTQKKRGRKEKSLFNMFNKSLDVATATTVSGRPKERVSGQSGKSVV